MKYLYNGIELPALPERDKQKYPHEIISVTPPTVLKKYYTASLFLMHTIQVGTGGVSCQAYDDAGNVVDDVGALKYTITWNEGEEAPTDTWGEPTAQSAGSVSISAKYIKWTNTDLVAPDGSWSLAASAPVPVLNPSVLMQGFMMGDAVKRMRNR